MARKALPEGWSRVPSSGRKERYLTASGEEVSRRQMENVRAREAGWSSWSQYQRTRLTKPFHRQMDMALTEGKQRRDLVGPDSEFSRAYREFQREGATTGNWRDKHAMGANSAWARLQVAQGIRDPRATYAIGDTPKKGKK